MTKKLKQLVGAVKSTVRQRVCTHQYRASVNQIITTKDPIRFECTNCNKVVFEQRRT